MVPLDWINGLGWSAFISFTLVLARVGGIVMTAPIFSGGDVPLRIRAFLSIALALVVTPTQLGASIAFPAVLPDYLVQVGGELLIGMILGLGVAILFAGVQLIGVVIAQMSGVSLADVFNPGFDESIPVFSQLLHVFALAVFFCVGGQRQLMTALLGTFTSLPLGQFAAAGEFGEILAALLTQSYVLAIRGAAPAMAALLLATIVLGLISRTLPQLNILAIGFSISACVTFVVMAVSLGMVAWLLQGQIEPALDTVLDGLTVTTA